MTDVTFAAHQSQITVLLGEPGSGTSTALRMINRLIEPSAGRIMLDGKPLKTLRRKALRRGHGYLLREGGLFPHKPAVENIAMVPRLKSQGRGKALTEANDLLRDVGLDRAVGRLKPSRLTAAQRQRVCLARAIAGEPSLVLMDHPFADLDTADRAAAQRLLRRLQAERSFTAVIATDDVEEALALADRLIVFESGTVVESGPPQVVLDAQNPVVTRIVGAERGYRALAYATTIGLPLQRVPVVRDPASADPEAGATLLVDNDAVPLGWIDPEQPGTVLPLGDVFDPGSGSLQEALNASLTSPVGLAVAVTRDTGRYAGVLSAAEIVAAAVEQRTVAVRAGAEAEAAKQHTTEVADEAEGAAPTSPRSPEPAVDVEETVQAAETDTPVAERAETKPATAIARRAQAARAKAVAETHPPAGSETLASTDPDPATDAVTESGDSREPAAAGAGRGER